MSLESLPEGIKEILQEQEYTIDSIGRSNSHIWIFDELVLKIESKSKQAKNEYQMLKWMKENIIVPNIKGYAVDTKNQYLLMTRFKGQMLSDLFLTNDGEVCIKLLAKGLKTLWSTPHTGCPNVINLDEKLREALERIKKNRIDIENAEPETFGENGFANPMELWTYLLENKPEEETYIVHGDYCLPNIFMLENEEVGYIDLGRAGIGDRWQDIALAVRSIKHNLIDHHKENQFSSLYSLFFKELGIEPNERKIQYYILLDELF
jgi:kanamycin kinase/aminoglycoside 3'-phosphotransferase-3